MFETLYIILKIALAGVLGILCALFSYFLDYCFWDGSIFKNYLPWLAKKCVEKRNYKRHMEILTGLLNKEYSEPDANILYKDEAQKTFWYKVLGGCAVCTNVYITFHSYILIWILSDWFTLWHYFPYMLISSFYLRKLTKATY